MATAHPTPLQTLLLDLPDACLLAVLQRLAADDQDPASLASAARAHSRLHQAAIAVLSTISCLTVLVSKQEQADSLLLYLNKHGQYVDDLTIGQGVSRTSIFLRQLPTSLVQLTSLQLTGLGLQLQPGGGLQGVFRTGLPLKQMRLHSCRLLDEEPASTLAAALALLPGLEHLSTERLVGLPSGGPVYFPTSALQGLPLLTYLQVSDHNQQAPEVDLSPTLQALTRLEDLRLTLTGCMSFPFHVLPISCGISTEALAGQQHLTRLGLYGEIEFDPAALAGLTQLRHLGLCPYITLKFAADVADLLRSLQHLQQLTHLGIMKCFEGIHQGDPPAAAFSALTASSSLQHLDLIGCTLPPDVWRHLFRAVRQLPHLRCLNVSGVSSTSLDPTMPAPRGSRLVSCCPGLQSLDIRELRRSAGRLAPLTGLRTLLCGSFREDSDQVLQVLPQLSGLRELQLLGKGEGEGLLLQLTRLQQLTRLKYDGLVHENDLKSRCIQVVDLQQSCAADQEPVWVQLLRHHSNHNNGKVAQQAAAALPALAPTGSG